MPGLEDDSVERQELWCHNCSRYVQFNIDLSLDGRCIIECPNCDHKHYRVVTKGVITEERWGSSNGSTAINQYMQYATGLSYSTTSISTSACTTINLYNWIGSTTTGY